MSKLLILIYCLFTLLFLPLTAEFTVGFFAALTLSCVLYVSPTPRRTYMLAAGYALASLFFPSLCVFFPLLTYDLSLQPYGFAVSGGAVLLFLYERSSDLPLCAFAILGITLSCYLAWQDRSWNTLDTLYIHTRDDSKERNLLLSEKNQHLIEKQNQEIYTATLQERNRIAREIHDNVGHMLSRSILMVGAMKAVNKQENLRESLDQLKDTLDTAMRNVRESVHDLHDDSVDLESAIRELVDGFTKCPIHLEYDMGRCVPKDIKYSFISIVSEALSNVIKHSDATQVQVKLREHPGLYQLIVQDNGTTPQDVPSRTTALSRIGISSSENSRMGLSSENSRMGLSSESNRMGLSSEEALSASESAASGMGLQNMIDRVNALSGNIEFHTHHGFSIFIMIPKQTKVPSP